MSENFTDHQTRGAGLRAGDRDRDGIADVLREQHVAGRLDADEFQERLDRAYAAKTFDELDELVGDLPRSEPAARAQPAQRAWRARGLPVVPLVALVVAAVVLSHGHLLWLALPLFFFVGRPLLWGTTGRRGGWGSWGCDHNHAAPPSRYL
jgi:Domain of unknown function (DUF1707)